ncbi:Plasmodium exported protein, unknown function [Plasmodium chabaudi chabaudi]|uniref:Plasmodium RESA N-terminal domain-containing protein n=1 Tax=Plasmodium chabaudi chabaudi TaxID=31271 RepID=A0A4V0K8T5_PLACU|nr:Plasmodium exported protein, unknown function [Plasmodium chabaudi chabaudi]VTZ69549.1 Plasmodium exported protein, unknown function [Plasmodium chabaudi chabaudi]|eukprot:XP_016654179.1 Plasmodium exported protein, unknown function [Plasmodium chabaudi chabaudi]
MGVIKHRIFMVLKIINIILVLSSTQIPLNNNRVYNFQKITEPSSFKYPTRILCCASIANKIIKVCKEICCGLMEDDDNNEYYGKPRHSNKTQHDNKTKHDNKTQHDNESEYDDEDILDELSDYDDLSDDDEETKRDRKAKRPPRKKHGLRLKYFGRPLPEDELIIGRENQSDENWDGTHKSKLNPKYNTAGDIDLKLINSKKITKALIPFRITDEDIEKSEPDLLMHMVITDQIRITPKVASLIFYNIQMQIHKDMLILWKRAKQLINKLVIKHNISHERHTLRAFDLKNMFYSGCLHIRQTSLRLYQEYAITHRNSLDSTFLFFLREHHMEVCNFFFDASREFYSIITKAFGDVDMEGIVLVPEDEKELFFSPII